MQPLTEQEVRDVFDEALHHLSDNCDKYGVRFSQRIIFGGLTDESETPVKLVYNQTKNIFVLFFSKHYMANKKEKVQKLISRYMLCTNDDGTFKTYNETMAAARKFADGNHYESTYMADWLKCDVEHECHIFCKKCNRTFYYPKDHDILQHPENYKCDCGGQLMLFGIRDCVTPEKKNLYFSTKCADGKQQPMYDREFFSGIDFTDADMKSFLDFAKRHDKVTRIQLIEEIKNAIDNNHTVMLKMYNRAFPKAYSTVNRYIPTKYKQIMNQISPVDFIETASKGRKRIKKKLNRSDFQCGDATFLRVNDYFMNKHTIKWMGAFVLEAIDANDNEYVRALIQADRTQFDKCINYMSKANKKKLEDWKMANGDIVQTKQ